MGSLDFGVPSFEGISKFLILEGRESWTWGALCAAVWLLLVPFPIAESSPPTALSYQTVRKNQWCGICHLLQPSHFQSVISPASPP